MLQNKTNAPMIHDVYTHPLRCSTFATVPLLSPVVFAFTAGVRVHVRRRRRLQTERPRPRDEQPKHHPEEVDVHVSGGAYSGQLSDGPCFGRAQSGLPGLAGAAAVHLNKSRGVT